MLLTGLAMRTRRTASSRPSMPYPRVKSVSLRSATPAATRDARNQEQLDHGHDCRPGRRSQIPRPLPRYCEIDFTSIETTIVPYGRRGAFSDGGVSSSTILDRKGRIVALITGSGGPTRPTSPSRQHGRSSSRSSRRPCLESTSTGSFIPLPCLGLFGRTQQLNASPSRIYRLVSGRVLASNATRQDQRFLPVCPPNTQWYNRIHSTVGSLRVSRQLK